MQICDILIECFLFECLIYSEFDSCVFAFFHIVIFNAFKN